jgi:hypothetical protein
VMLIGVPKELNHHQLEAGGLTIGGLNRRLEEKAAGSRWFAPRAERPSGGLKPPTDNQNFCGSPLDIIGN